MIRRRNLDCGDGSLYSQYGQWSKVDRSTMVMIVHLAVNPECSSLDVQRNLQIASQINFQTACQINC